MTWRDARQGVALATVVKTWGSSPRPAGSHLVVRDDMLFVGSVSGGCVEGKVVEAALDTMEDGRSRLLEFGVSNAEAWEVGLACGGRVQVLVEPLPTQLDALQEAREAKRPVVLATPVEGEGDQHLVYPDSDAPLAAQAASALRADRASTVEVDGTTWFLRPYNPPLRLILVGAVHIAQPLSVLAQQSGYAVTVVDPRAAFAAAARFPDVELVQEWPDDALNALAVDVRTAIVTLTHDPKLDDPALKVALRSPAFYIGALGSSRTHKARMARLERAGFDPDALARIHGPVGLSIGARSPAEIAVSVLAEMTQVLRTAPVEVA